MQDWSDHALWWPDNNMWLTRTRSTLDQYGVQADAVLHFSPMHKVVHMQLPDLQYVDMRVDFSVKVFTAVINICKELGQCHYIIHTEYYTHSCSLTISVSFFPLKNWAFKWL